MANTRSSRHGKRRRQACGLDLSPREVAVTSGRVWSNVICFLRHVRYRYSYGTGTCMRRYRTGINQTAGQWDNVTKSADT